MSNSKITEHFHSTKKNPCDRNFKSQAKLNLSKIDPDTEYNQPFCCHQEIDQTTRVLGNPLVRDPAQFDQSDTVRAPIRVSSYKMETQSNEAHLLDAHNTSKAIPVQQGLNKRAAKVNQILKKDSLRNRLKHMLPNHLAFPIGYKNQRLIEKMIYIDRTMAFFIENRNNRFTFFEDVRKSIQQSMRCTIMLTDLQQLLFLDPTCYILKWEKNQDLKKYDILLKNPAYKIQTEEQRKHSLRKLIYQFIAKQHQLFLEINNLIFEETIQFMWHPDFNIQNINIPKGQLPTHPHDKKIRLKDMSQSELDQIPNFQVKSIIKKQIQNSTQSVSVSNAASFILNKKTQQQFTNQLYDLIRKKQQKLLEIKKSTPVDKLDKDFMLRFLEEILALYISKGFNNMFLVNVIQIMYKRLDNNYSFEEIKSVIQKLVKNSIRFLSENKMQKGVILKIDKDKYQEIKSFYSNLKE